MQEGVTGAGMFVALADRGFFDSFKEANTLAHHLREAHEHSDSVLVRDLAAGHDKPFGMTASPEEVEQSTAAALEQAVAALEAKSAEELPAYRQLVLEVAQSVAEAAKGALAAGEPGARPHPCGSRLWRLAPIRSTRNQSRGDRIRTGDLWPPGRQRYARQHPVRAAKAREQAQEAALLGEIHRRRARVLRDEIVFRERCANLTAA